MPPVLQKLDVQHENLRGRKHPFLDWTQRSYYSVLHRRQLQPASLHKGKRFVCRATHIYSFTPDCEDNALSMKWGPTNAGFSYVFMLRPYFRQGDIRPSGNRAFILNMQECRIIWLRSIETIMCKVRIFLVLNAWFIICVDHEQIVTLTTIKGNSKIVNNHVDAHLSCAWQISPCGMDQI